MAAKERSIESLRDTLSTTKRTFENRMSQVDAELALKDAEVRMHCLACAAACSGAQPVTPAHSQPAP